MYSSWGNDDENKNDDYDEESSDTTDEGDVDYDPQDGHHRMTECKLDLFGKQKERILQLP